MVSCAPPIISPNLMCEICAPKKISFEFRTNLNLLKSQHIFFTFIAQTSANFVRTSVCQNSKDNIRKKHTTLLAKNARHPYSLGMAKLV